MVASAASEALGAPGLPRFELRVERLQMSFRFTLAFHAREVRFEVSQGDGPYERLFPETFSFHAARHDPTELFLQLEDLLSKPRLFGSKASPRDVRNLMVRMFSGAPRYLDGLVQHVEAAGQLTVPQRLRLHQDVALLSQILLRFVENHDFEVQRPLRLAIFSFRRRIYQSLRVLVAERVDPDYLAAYVSGDVKVVNPGDDPTESGFFHVLEGDDEEAAHRLILRMAERSFYVWLEGVCLDEENQAFEKEDSPFASRENEVLAAITVAGSDRIDHSADLMPFLRRADRNCGRLLGKLERWFLRVYDIRHSSAIISQQALLLGARPGADRALTWHTPRIHAGVLLTMLAPFVGAAFAYDVAPRLFDWLCVGEVVGVYVGAAWFLLYRFCWKRDLSFFHASVPRIGAGIIVGYLPVFLIDEVWDLAGRQHLALDAVVLLLGLITLLYIYVEIARRIPDTSVAFARARAIFLLGVVEALGVGLVMTSLIGPFMVVRNWSPGPAEVPISMLQESMPPMIGHLPHIMGVGGVWVFPSALLLMTFLSFFIGIFLQLMWEELPITEPL